MVYVVSMKNTFIRVSEETDNIQTVRRSNSLPRTWKYEVSEDKEPQTPQSDASTDGGVSTIGEQSSSWAMMSDDSMSSDDFQGLPPWELRPMPTPEARTQLKVSSRVFEPRVEEMPSEVGQVIHALNLALCCCSQVTRVRVENGSMGFATYMYVTLQNMACQAFDMFGVAQKSLLDATASSQNVYVLGYAAQPFVRLNGHGFKAILSEMPASVQHRVCWDSYQYGSCPRPSTCRWGHPTQLDMMEVHVIFNQVEC